MFSKYSDIDNNDALLRYFSIYIFSLIDKIFHPHDFNQRFQISVSLEGHSKIIHGRYIADYNKNTILPYDLFYGKNLVYIWKNDEKSGSRMIHHGCDEMKHTDINLDELMRLWNAFHTSFLPRGVRRCYEMSRGSNIITWK